MNLKNLKEEIELCAFCPLLCEHICTVGTQTKSMVDFPTGKCIALLDILNKERMFDERTVEAIYKCAGCYLCESWCSTNVKVSDIIEAARAEIVEQGKAPPYVMELKKRIDAWGNPYSESLAKNAVIYTNKKKHADILYFAGCAIKYFQPEIAEATAKLLKQIDADFTMLENEMCCGSPLFRNGFPKDGKKLAERTARAINESRCDTVVVSCPGCYKAFVEDYNKHGVDLRPEVIHVTEYFTSKKLSFSRDVPMAVTYQDPCALGRGLGLYEPPRDLLKQIPGIKFVEMRWTKEKAHCCGGTLGVFPRLSTQIAKSRLAEAQETGAEALITACPMCKRMFQLLRGKLKVLDILELAAQAIK
jgi:heterodisulfide reductase subunit D